MTASNDIGSAVFVWMPGICSSIVSYFESMFFSSKASKHRATHMAMMRTPTLLFEARSGYDITTTDWEVRKEQILKKGGQYMIFRRVNAPTYDDAHIIEEECTKMKNWKYSLWELPLQAADAIFCKLTGNKKQGWDAIVFRKLGDLWDKGVICSQTANRIYILLNWVPLEAKYASPEETRRWMAQSSEWVIAETSSGWVK